MGLTGQLKRGKAENSVETDHRLIRSTTNTLLIAIFVLSVFVLATASPSFGAPPSRPTKKACNQADKNERIACKHENLNTELYDLVDEATSDNVVLFTPKQKGHLLNERDRAEKARARGRDAKEYDNVGKKSKIECSIREYEDPDCFDPLCDSQKRAFCDGICEDPFPENDDADDICNKGSELCAETLNDGFGDDNGLCETKGPKDQREPCLEACDDKAISSNNDNYDSEATDDFEESLDDLAGVMEETKGKLQVRNQLMLSMAQHAVAPQAGSGECADLRQEGGDRQFDYTTLQGMLVGTNVAMGAYDTCMSAAGQTAVFAGFGGNANAVCVVLAVAGNVLNTLSDAFELQDDYITASRLDESLDCLEQTDDQLREALNKLGNIEGELTEIKSRVYEIIDLLNTPQGRRPDFPTK
jgi:hypothetical protein